MKRRVLVPTCVLAYPHLHALGAEPYAAFAPGDDGPPLDDWMTQAAMDADGLGVRWNPNAAPVSWAARFDAARRALAIAVGDGVIVAEDGNILVGTRARVRPVRTGRAANGDPGPPRRGAPRRRRDRVRGRLAADGRRGGCRGVGLALPRVSAHERPRPATHAAMPALPAARSRGLPALARSRCLPPAAPAPARPARRGAGAVLGPALAALPRDRGRGRGGAAGAWSRSRAPARRSLRRSPRRRRRASWRRRASSARARRAARRSATPSARSTRPMPARRRRRSP